MPTQASVVHDIRAGYADGNLIWISFQFAGGEITTVAVDPAHAATLAKYLADLVPSQLNKPSDIN